MTPASGEVPPPTAALLAGLGPFFSVQARASAHSWQSVGALLTGHTLDDQVTRAQHFLASRAGQAVHQRVAASITSLGLFARLMSPYLGAAAAGVLLPTPSLDGISFEPTLSQPWPLHLSGDPGHADPQAALNVLVDPLIDTIAKHYSLSTTILRGNAASGVFGAIGMMAREHPALGGPAREIGARLLDEPLAGTGTMYGVKFVRTSCCLFYRVPGGGYCGDCVLISDRLVSRSRRGRRPTI